MSPKQFLRRSATVQAMQFTSDSAARTAAWCDGTVTFVNDHMKLLIRSCETQQVASLGDWVISDEQGCFSTMDAITFHTNYDLV